MLCQRLQRQVDDLIDPLVIVLPFDARLCGLLSGRVLKGGMT